MIRQVVVLSSLGFFLACFAVPAHAADVLPRAKPEEAAMSSERLGELGKTVNAEIAHDQLPGAVLAIARRGKLIYFEAFGYRDKASATPMTVDTIFPIASMTKPMVAAGALQLFEQGKLLLEDPLAKYFPQFAKMEVAVLNENKDAIVAKEAAARQITIFDLFRHTSGLIYGGRGTTPVHKMYPEGSASAAAALTGPEFLDKLGSLPLLHQPGTVWDYGFGLDILGLVIESISGQTLADYLQKSLFEPLGMTNTGLGLPADKLTRVAKALPSDPATGRPQNALSLPENLKFQCGGGCAAGTASDYLRFALALLNKGALGETRILGRSTVEYMLSNQIGPEVKNLIGNADPTRADYGFGLGLAVRTTPGIVPLLGSMGDFSWPGAYGTNWWADPREELAVVWMAQSPGPIRWKYRQLINALVYRAIAD